MPSSRPNTIPTVIHLLRQLKPSSILDVGIGFGKWGHLFREYTDILAAEREPPRYQRENWKVRIDGIEGHADYLTDMHRFLYNDIYLGDACAILPTLSAYDLIFMGDIIEHLEKETGRSLLRDAILKANKAVIVSTPRGDTGQEDLCGNELERHRSVWSTKDFRAFDNATIRTIDGSTLLAIFTKPSAEKLHVAPARQPKTSDLRRLQRAKQRIVDMIPADESFILVDEEQIRSDLPHKRVIPFLEKDGCYWGPPPDSATAIQEFERLHRAGAKYIAFIWSTSWWLEYYPTFAVHLRCKFHCLHEDDCSVIFDLRSQTIR